MYIEKNSKSKFVYFVLSFLLVLSGFIAFNPSCINKFYGETLCANELSGVPSVSDFDYTSENFGYHLDGYISQIIINSSGSYQYYVFVLRNFDDTVHALSGDGISTNQFTLYSYNSSTTGLTTASIGTQQGWHDGNTSRPRVNISSGTFTYTISTSLPSILCIYTPSTNTYLYFASNSLYGMRLGYLDGINSGNTGPTYEEGYQDGYADGEDAGFHNGYDLGWDDGIEAGKELGYDNGYEVGYNEGYEEGNSVGFSDGYNEGYGEGADTVYTFSYLITSVVDVPVQTFRSLFNFDFLGFNLFNFFIAILTACVLIVLIRLVSKRK